ncbi:MAG: hypothetical protein DDT34_01306 [Firmicutes bacterium]|nr:hypothetical protein [Bacillota bacterium]
MKRALALALMMLFLVLLPSAAAGQVPARPPQLTFVNDYANLLSASQRDALTQVLQGIEQSTTAEMVVVTVPDLGGADAFSFSQQLFTEWGLGKRDKNNGLLILVSLREREFRFHTGYGLEGLLPDSYLGGLIRQYITPAFGEGRFYDGLALALLSADGIVPRLEREYNVKIDATGVALPGTGEASLANMLGGATFFVIFLLLMMTRGGRGMLWFLLGHSMGRSSRGFGGNNRGGFGGGGFGSGRSGGGGAGGRW